MTFSQKMSRLLSSWFNQTSNSSNAILTHSNLIKSFLFNKQTKTFALYLKRKDTKQLCVDTFFHFCSQIDDDQFLVEIFRLINQSIGSKQTSNLLTTNILLSIRQANFDLCHKLLYLPYLSIKISLSTYDFIQLIHQCRNFQQLISCLSKLIERNLPFDSTYPLWILMSLFEHYQIGDELILDYLFKFNRFEQYLFQPYGKNSLTPLMLFFHRYSNDKCRHILDSYLLNLQDLTVFNRVDRWNRSYLTHLLCGHCQHDMSIENERCSHEDVILSRFIMLYQLGNRCEHLSKMILTSDYCFSLQMSLMNYFIETNHMNELNIKELFIYLPWKYISSYTNQLKTLIQNQNLDSLLEHLIVYRAAHNINLDYTIKFLLQHGAHLINSNALEQAIRYLLVSTQSLIPFVLLDFSFSISIPYDTFRSSTVIMYVIRTIQCGYPNEFEKKFDEFKLSLSRTTVESIEKIIDLNNPRTLKRFCLQKLRKTLTNLSDETIDRLKDSLRYKLRRSIRLYGYDECYFFFKTILPINN